MHFFFFHSMVLLFVHNLFPLLALCGVCFDFFRSSWNFIILFTIFLFGSGCGTHPGPNETARCQLSDRWTNFGEILSAKGLGRLQGTEIFFDFARVANSYFFCPFFFLPTERAGRWDYHWQTAAHHSSHLLACGRSNVKPLQKMMCMVWSAFFYCCEFFCHYFVHNLLYIKIITWINPHFFFLLGVEGIVLQQKGFSFSCTHSFSFCAMETHMLRVLFLLLLVLISGSCLLCVC